MTLFGTYNLFLIIPLIPIAIFIAHTMFGLTLPLEEIGVAAKSALLIASDLTIGFGYWSLQILKIKIINRFFFAISNLMETLHFLILSVSAALLEFTVHFIHFVLFESAHAGAEYAKNIDQTSRLDTASTIVIGSLFCVVALMFILAIVSAILKRKISQLTKDLQFSEERQRTVAALGEQRAMRVQTEALIEGIRERKKIEEKLSRVAFYDSLTGLYNRAYFIDAIA